MGKYIKENYAVPDHRGEAEYASWQRMADYVDAMVKNQELVGQTEIVHYIESICNNRYYHLFVSVDGRCTTSDDKLYFARLGIPIDGSTGIWSRCNEDGRLWWSGQKEMVKYFDLNGNDICLVRKFDALSQIYVNSIICNNLIIDKKVSNGLNIIVYDGVTQRIIDCIGINADADYTFVH